MFCAELLRSCVPESRRVSKPWVSEVSNTDIVMILPLNNLSRGSSRISSSLPSCRAFPVNPKSFSRQLCASNSTASSFITTPIFYVNATPHIGHLYTALLSDAYARFERLKGRTVVFATGTDEHGLKIEKAAKVANVTPQSHCDKVSQQFDRMCKEFDVSNTHFIRTTDVKHKSIVAQFWVIIEHWFRVVGLFFSTSNLKFSRTTWFAKVLFTRKTTRDGTPLMMKLSYLKFNLQKQCPDAGRKSKSILNQDIRSSGAKKKTTCSD